MEPTPIVAGSAEDVPENDDESPIAVEEGEEEQRAEAEAVE